MMKNRNIKSKILTVYIYTMLLSFGTWLLGGVVYNFCYREEINDNLITLQLELKYIANLQNHKLQNTGLTNSKTLIAKSIVGEFTDQHNTPQVIRNFYYEYFNTHGWIIKESRNYPKIYIKAQNTNYIITVEQITEGENKWRIIIGNNTFFERHKL
ncbi:hypothetical protein [Dialister succinatiphilus]|uniref:hypothetical protein n=1 Tax=Dialister succinatiphilus TaxID=487173 RepID=UPI00402650B1